MDTLSSTPTPTGVRVSLPDLSVRINGLQAQRLVVQGGLREMMVLAFPHKAAGTVVGASAARADLYHTLVFLHVKRDDMREQSGLAEHPPDLQR